MEEGEGLIYSATDAKGLTRGLADVVREAEEGGMSGHS